MKTRLLGSLPVSEIGFGAMSFTAIYGASPDRAEAISRTRRLDRLAENVGAAQVVLTGSDMAGAEIAVMGMTITGERLPAAVLQLSYL